jgi:LDH2 family malate/lactate/ureidoglycolate dehydrogenase
VSDQVVIQAEPLRAFCQAVFTRVGVPADEAAIVADTLVEADLRGVHSHGVWWMTTYTRRLQQGGLNPRPALRVVQDTPAIVLLDADRAMGQVAGVVAMRHAIVRAEAGGVGVASVRNSNHFGAAAYYAQMAVAHNQIGFAATDAEPIMAPWGGAKAVVGNNPFAYAIPAPEFALVLDMAQSVVAWGKIFLAAQRNEPIPATWALGPAGETTTDPHTAMAGLLLPVGGYKGYGLALVMEVLCGVLSGATFGLTVPAMSDDRAPQDFGHFFLALNIAHFMPPAEFQQRMARLMAEHRGVPLAQGTERTYLPGEIEHQKRQARLTQGIPLDRYIVQSLLQLGNDLNLSTDGLDDM